MGTGNEQQALLREQRGPLCFHSCIVKTTANTQKTQEQPSMVYPGSHSPTHTLSRPSGALSAASIDEAGAYYDRPCLTNLLLWKIQKEIDCFPSPITGRGTSQA